MSTTQSQPRQLNLPFTSESVDSMIALLKSSKLPDKPPIPTNEKWSLGIDLDYLANLKEAFESTWSWNELEQRMRLEDNYTVEMKEGSDELNIHFIHCKSSRENATTITFYFTDGQVTNDLRAFLICTYLNICFKRDGIRLFEGN